MPVFREGKRRHDIWWPEETFTEIERMAEKLGISATAYIVQAVNRSLVKNGKELKGD